MPTKEKLSEDINDMLGTNIEWDRMLEDDLQHLHSMLEDGSLAEPIIKQYAKKHGKEKLDSEIDEWYPGKLAARLL